MSTSPPAGPPASAFIELARAGNAIERLVGLISLESALRSRGASDSDLSELRLLRADLRPGAERQAQALVTFFEDYGEAVDAMAAQAVKDGRQGISGRMDDFSQAGAGRARAFLHRLAADDDRRDDDEGLCEAYDTLIAQEDVKCIMGSRLHCAFGAQWFQLATEDGCR